MRSRLSRTLGRLDETSLAHTLGEGPDLPHRSPPEVGRRLRRHGQRPNAACAVVLRHQKEGQRCDKSINGLEILLI